MSQEKPLILVAEARFYDDLADALYDSAAKVLEEAGCQIKRVQVPGVFELPSVVRFAVRAMEMRAAGSRFAGFVTLGCVIRGETTHYDIVCNETARGLMDLSTRYALAHGFGVITCENRDQAWARADATRKDVGGRAARACLDMINLKKELHLVPA